MAKRTSRLLLVSLTVIMLISVLMTSAYAAYAYVYIYPGDGPVQSSSISATNGARYDGWNYADSGHSLYITLQWSDGSGWYDGPVSLMAIGSGATGDAWEPTGTHLWRVQLNPQWAYTDCRGWGKVSNH